MRASAFARSETLLQLAWVVGGGLGIALPSNGRLGFAVAAGAARRSPSALMLWGRHRGGRTPPVRRPLPGDARTTPLGPPWS